MFLKKGDQIMTRHELADAMIRGKSAKNVVESRAYYIYSLEYALDAPVSKPCYACALGCALIGKHNGDFSAAEMEFERAGGIQDDVDEAAIFARLLEIPRPLADFVETQHLNGMPIQQIAAWLKSSEGEGDHD
jgi:hypothetical protein